MLRSTLPVSAQYFERLRRDDDDVIDTEARKERRQFRSLLKKKDDAHPYDR
jgi:hypothetical protein